MLKPAVNEKGHFTVRPNIGSEWQKQGDNEVLTVAAICSMFVIMEGCKRIDADYLVNNYERVGL